MNEDNLLSDPIKLSDESPEPIPVPRPAPVPVPVPAVAQSAGDSDAPKPVKPASLIKHHKADELGQIAIDDLEEEHTPVVKRVGGAGNRLSRKAEYKRPVNITGTGATRCRMFRAKMSADPLLVMENNINDWIDSEQIEVKFIEQTVGVMEGKRSEANLIVTVWY